MPRSRITIPLGEGLSRNVGAYVAQANTWRDLRNVELAEGKLRTRRGLTLASTIGSGTVIAIEPIRASGVAVAFVYSNGDEVDPSVRVEAWKLNGDGSSPALIGPVWTYSSLPARIPRVIAADSNDQLLIAHDHDNFAQRKRSRVYNATTNTLADLSLGTGMTTPKFRGFRTYLEYVFGWGWSTDAEPERPEIVRANIPGEPLNWDINHYFVAGQPGDPVLNLDQAGNTLMVQKPSSTYEIRGTSRDDFGIFPADKTLGVLSSRASYTVGGVNYRWTHRGPRRSTGGLSSDLALPLDLDGPAPDTLATPSVVNRAFVFTMYDPTTQELTFVFNSQFGYTLHLADEDHPRWSYRTYAPLLRCAGVLYDNTI